MKTRTILILLLILNTLFILCRLLSPEYKPTHYQVADTIHTQIIDTIQYIAPTPTATTLVGHITVSPSHAPPSKADTVVHIHHDTIYIPRQQIYISTAHYQAWISGYRPALDSINIFERTNTNTIIPRYKPHRWSIGPHIGYDLKGPTIGLSLQYRLLSW